MNLKNREKILFYKNNLLLGKFIAKYIFKFFLYGYLFALGALAMGFLFTVLFSTTYGIVHYLQFLWFVPIAYCLVRLGIILSTTNYKWRLYRIAHYRLKTRGYSENYFKYEIFEPCTRLIVKDILYEYSLKNEYKMLKKKYLHVNQRIEDEKARLLDHVVRKNIKKQLQEAVHGKNL